MSHTGPDWGNEAPKATVYSDIDLAELAARMGSIVTYDRRGDVVWFDNFEHGIQKWDGGAVGTGGSVKWASDAARSGGFSAKLTGGSTSVRMALIERSLSTLNPTRLGVEFSFALNGTIDVISLSIDTYTGAIIHYPQIQWDNTNQVLQYYDSGGTPVTIASGLLLAGSSDIFHTIKLVWDFENLKYVRLILNEKEYSLADIPYNSGVSGATPRMALQIRNKSRSGYNDIVWVDDVIVTQNEP